MEKWGTGTGQAEGCLTVWEREESSLSFTDPERDLVTTYKSGKEEIDKFEDSNHITLAMP
jgi:hypothetical protein